MMKSSVTIFLAATIIAAALFAGLLAWVALTPAGSATPETAAAAPVPVPKDTESNSTNLVVTATETQTVEEAHNPSVRLTQPGLLALEEENRQLKRVVQRLQTQLTDILNWILANFKGRYPLPERQLSKMDMNPVSASFSLDPEVAELLHITPGEQELINDAFAYGRVSLREMELAHATLSESNDTRAVVQIQPFPDEGEALRQDLYGALSTTIGQDRFNRFVQIGEKGLNRSFDYFGAAARTITFELDYPDGSDTPQLVINDQVILQDDETHWRMQATEQVVDKMPERYADYGSLLPESFATPSGGTR